MAEALNQPYDHHRGRQPLLRPTSLPRTLGFLAASWAGYVAVNMFWAYLATGDWTLASLERFRQQCLTPLGEQFTFPLDVFAYPWMILVDSLLLTVIMAVPVILAVLYRLRVVWPFVAAIALAAHAPLLAVATAAGCLLAARTPLRSDMPFLAILLGLIPAALYLYLLGLGVQDSAALMPLQRLVLNAPFILAMVAAVLAAAAVLAMARLTQFRSGVVLPVLVLLSTGPFTVFYSHIGTGELEYRLIASPQRLGTGDSMLKSEWIEASAQALPEERRRVAQELPARREALIEECNNFLLRHPRSDRAPAVMWIRAQGASLQLERQRDGEVRFTAEFVLPQSQAYWEALLGDPWSATPQAALAQWRLGNLALRRGEVAQGVSMLQSAAQRLRGVKDARPRWSQEPAWLGVFEPPQSVPDRRYYAEALFEVERLLWLVGENVPADDAAAAKALADYLEVNPHQGDQVAVLRQLALKHQATPLGDNLRVASAKAGNDLDELLSLATGPACDAAIEANYELGLVALRRDLPSAVAVRLQRPREYFMAVRSARPNPYIAPAEERLAWLARSGLAPQKPAP
jgi:hypothetical protein